MDTIVNFVVGFSVFCIVLPLVMPFFTALGIVFRGLLK